MKKLILLATLATLGTQAWSADWTPYLKGMQDSCSILNARPEPNRANRDSLDRYQVQHFLFKYNLRDYENKRITINSFPLFPNTLKNDVYSITLDYGLELHLRNATAFGYPLRKINISEEGYDKSISIYFDPKSDIRSILPQFTYDIGVAKIRPNTDQHYRIIYRDPYASHGLDGWLNSPITILSSTKIPHGYQDSYDDYSDFNPNRIRGDALSKDNGYTIGDNGAGQQIGLWYSADEYEGDMIECRQGYTPG